MDPASEHFELFYGPFAEAELVARVGRVGERAVAVEFLGHDADAVEAARLDVDEYVLRVGGPRAWEYLRYHCATGSNFYSKVHWGYFKPE